MAINYQKVGWDTTKYFNPTNMNHMDDGIKAACDKADENEASIADVNSKLGNTDISAIGDGTVTGGLNALNSNLKTLLKTEKITFSGNYSQGTVTLVLSKDIGDYRIIALSDVYDYYGIFSIDRWDIRTENSIRIMFNCKTDHDNNGYVNVLCIKK